MTIINGIKIDCLKFNSNPIKESIVNNNPIEEKLHVIAVISNPCLFAKRYKLMNEFIERMEREEPNVILYIVELTYKQQKFIITNKDNPRHLQIRTECPLWHKENMINLGVKYLLPNNWKAFAWIDADLEFENNSWALDTLKILNGCKDIVQVFSHCVDMDNDDNVMSIFSSAGYNYIKYNKYYPSIKDNVKYSHPGYAWAITRKAYEKIGGLYENAILGSGDFMMLMALLKNGKKSLNDACSKEYKKDIVEYEKKIGNLRFGYVPGVIRHYYHGSKQNRKYGERWKILVKYQYEPSKFIAHDDKGIIIPTHIFSQEFRDEIYNYFIERNEDN